MQKTDFPFEVIIGEDLSTDGTREIVLAYQQKHPDKIKVLLSEQNVGGARNHMRIQQVSQGKYQAICEGDDYWIDPLKLQKQVDFMEANPGISLCFHNAFILDETFAVTRLFFEAPVKEVLDFDHATQISTPTASVLARTEILATLPEWRLKIWCGDVLFRLWCAHHGNLGYLDEIMSVYRIHPHGMTSLAFHFREKYYSEELFLYQQLDKDTGYQHSASIQSQIKRVQEKYRRNQHQNIYYLIHPMKLVARFREYRLMIKKHQKIKFFGN